MNRELETSYLDLKGRVWTLAELDTQERQLLSDLRLRVETHPDWNDFDNYWMAKVTGLYDARGLSREQSSKSAVYQIAQDLNGRLAISLGLARMPDYRDQLREIIRTHFGTRRAFCAAVGLSEDMLSHVLAGRKHLALDTLADALQRIGYHIQLVPDPPTMINKSS
jgi:hypothetical protein